MANKIFGIGLSRTGTTSLHIVLDKLGYKAIHYIPDLISDYDSEIVEQFDALLDTPIPSVYQYLDKKYPDSKFILTTRNKEAWLNSMNWMFKHGKVLWAWEDRLYDYHQRFYGTTNFDEKILSRHFDLFHESVYAYFKDRTNNLLILNIDKGIQVENICYFLNKPLINIEFPKANIRKHVSFYARSKYELKHLIKKLIKKVR